MSDNNNDFVPSQEDDGSENKDTLVSRISELVRSSSSTVLFVVFCAIAGVIGFIITALFINGVACTFQLLNRFLFNLNVNPNLASGDIAENMKQIFITCQKNNVMGPLRVVTGIIGGVASVYQAILLLTSTTGKRILNSLS
jgi:hypothetical protein